MRYDNEAYDKIFPRKKEVEKVETVVDSFRPTEDEQKKDEQKKDDASVKTEPKVDVSGKDSDDADGQHDSADTE